MLQLEQKKIQYGQYEVPTSEKCISLNVGQPCNKMLPLNERNLALEKIIDSNDPSSMQYGKIPGYDSFRDDFAAFLSNMYTNDCAKMTSSSDAHETMVYVDPNEIIMTNGNTGGLMLLLSLFAETGMTIFVEDPTYFLALGCFADMKLNIVSIPMTQNGLDLKQLKNELKKIGQQKCLLYTIPINQNPTGYTLSEPNRVKLSVLADEYPNLLVFADEVYHMLSFNDSPGVFPMCYYHRNFISMGSFSKIFAPALRLGWLHCLNEDIVKRIVDCGQLDSSGCVNPLGCQIAHELIKQNLLINVIQKWQTFLSTNCDALFSAIQTHLSEHIQYIEKPNGGYFIWIKFKPYVDTVKLSTIMEEYGVKYHHGNKFSTSKAAKSCVRLSFSWYDYNDYDIFVQRMKKLIEENSMKDTITIDVDLIEEVRRNHRNVYVLGHKGRLGSLICKKLNDLNVVLYAANISFGGTIEKNSEMDFIDDQSLIVDVSSPEGTQHLLRTLLNNKTYCPIVIGTTGTLPTELISEYSKFAPVAVSSNFSKGINQIKKFIDVIEKDNWFTNLVEKHHIHKRDAPSGTAKLLAKWYGRNHIPINEINSVREGEIFGEHHLTLNGAHEYITISHVAKSRELFADGAINWIKFISQQKPGIYESI